MIDIWAIRFLNYCTMPDCCYNNGNTKTKILHRNLSAKCLYIERQRYNYISLSILASILTNYIDR